MIVLVYMCRYADRAKQIMCKAVINEDPNAKVRTYVRTCVCVCVCVCVCIYEHAYIRNVGMPILYIWYRLFVYVQHTYSIQYMHLCTYVRIYVLYAALQK